MPRNPIDWAHNLGRDFLVGICGGLLATGFYVGLFRYTTNLRGLGISGLGPAEHIVFQHLMSYCIPKANCHYLILITNVLLYAFWIVVVLVCFDLLRHLARALVAKLR